MLILALLLCQDPPAAVAPPPPPASPEITAIRNACAKLAEAASYTVQQTTLEDGGGFGGPAPAAAPPAGGGEATPAVPPAPVPMVFTAQVQKGKPTRFTQDKLEAWREGEALVYRNAAGAWERYSRGQGGGFGGGAGAGAEADPEAARLMRTRMTLASTQMAHELLAGLDAKIAMAAATKEGGKTIITGNFTPEGAASLGRRGRGRTGGQGGGAQGGGQGGTQGGQGGGQGGAPAMVSSGSFRCVVAADGSLESIAFDTLTKGSFNDTPFERKRHVELRVSAVGSTALDVPEDVAKKLAEKPADPSKEF